MNESNINRPINRARFLIIALAFFFCAAAPPINAATRTVDNTSDDASQTACTAAANDCSLRGAIVGAAPTGSDTINFASSVFNSPQIININSQLNINQSLTITGTGARLLTVRRNPASAATFAVFSINLGSTVTISGLTVAGGTQSGIINNSTNNALTLDRVRVTGNSILGSGGGILNNAPLTLINSLVDNNTAGSNAAGITNGSNGTLTVANTTIADNTVTGGNISGAAGIDTFGTVNLNNVTITGNVNNSANANTTGGVDGFGATVSVRNTIISGNTAANSESEDVRGNFTSNGGNLVQVTTGSFGFGISPDITGQPDGLGALQNNGGDTDTREPQSGSPAIDNGNSCVITQVCASNNPPVPLTTDQRGAGFARRRGLTVDSGAAERQATVRTVDNLSDEASQSACAAAANDCSLRGAIDGAQPGDTINFGALFNTPQTITVGSRLFINKNLTITGTGARNLTVRRDPAATLQVFFIPIGTVTISGLTVMGGNDSGIVNQSDGTLTLDRVRVTGNSAIIGGGSGGGIDNSGALTLLNSLVDNNIATGFGAGIFNSGTLTAANTTVAGNTITGSSTGGAGINNLFGTLNFNNVTITGNVNNSTNADTTGGVSNLNGTVNIRNTVVSGNQASGANKDVSGDFLSNGNNFIGTTTGSTGFTQPTDITGQADGLGELRNNGGDTDTRLPSLNPTLLNKGNNCVVNQTCAVNNPPVALAFDQRGAGFPRLSSVAVDIGAAELRNPTAAGANVGGRVAQANGRGINRALVAMTDASGNQRVAYTNQLGYYQFENVAGGQVYVFTAQHRRYQFDQPTQVQFIGEETNDINFTGTATGIFGFDIWNLPSKGNQ